MVVIHSRLITKQSQWRILLIKPTGKRRMKMKIGEKVFAKDSSQQLEGEITDMHNTIITILMYQGDDNTKNRKRRHTKLMIKSQCITIDEYSF